MCIRDRFGEVTGRGFVGEVESKGIQFVLRDLKFPFTKQKKSEVIESVDFMGVRGKKPSVRGGSGTMLEPRFESPMFGEGMTSFPLFVVFTPKMTRIPTMEMGMSSLVGSKLVRGLTEESASKSVQRMENAVAEEYLFGSDMMVTQVSGLDQMIGLRTDVAKVSVQEKVQMEELVSLPVPVTAPPPVMPPLIPMVFDKPKRRYQTGEKRYDKRKKGYRERKSPVKMYWIGG